MGVNRYKPLAFTEQGIAQLSSVLNSDRAIAVNIQIIRLFTKMRKMLLTSQELLFEMEAIRKKVASQDEKIDLIFAYLKRFIRDQEQPQRRIGFKE